MRQYHKIQGIYKRYIEGEKKGRFIEGDYSLEEFAYLANNNWQWTEKIDGTNIRIIYDLHPMSLNIVAIKGKTDRAEIPKHLLVKLKELFTQKKLQDVFGIDEEAPPVCLYGEGYGYKIQSGGKYFPENPKEVGFILFDIKIGNTWLKREDVDDIARKLNILSVPVVGHGTIQDAIEKVRNGLIGSKFGDFLAEGIVIRPVPELLDRRGHRIITKIKYKDFKED